MALNYVLTHSGNEYTDLSCRVKEIYARDSHCVIALRIAYQTFKSIYTLLSLAATYKKRRERARKILQNENLVNF